MSLSRVLWLWALASAVAAVAILLLAERSWPLALTGALSTAFFTAATGWFMVRRARVDLEAYARAARGELPDAPQLHDEPVRIAKEVQTTVAHAKEMARQLAVLRAVIDGMAEGVWITSEDGVVVEHNNAVKEMLYTGREIVGQRPAELLHSTELQDAVVRACREGTSSRLELSVEGLRPRTLSIHVSPLGRELSGSAAVFFDVTELRRLEKVRKDFVANVSHELRTPITAIRGYAETLKAGAIADPVNAKKMVEIIHRQSERLSELVEDLLELSRLESRQIQLAERPVEVADAAARALETIRPKSRARNIAVELQVPAGLHVQGDQRALEQIILNLVDNAVKYTPAGGRVWVSAQAYGDTVITQVGDNGPGIDQKHLPRLFERFYRVDKGRSRDMGGTGLGLSIVKHLANAMKGDVRVESAPGHGSTFSITLRKARPEDVAAPPADEPESEADAGPTLPTAPRGDVAGSPA